MINHSEQIPEVFEGYKSFQTLLEHEDNTEDLIILIKKMKRYILALEKKVSSYAEEYGELKA
jgi:hypothetical protein